MANEQRVRGNLTSGTLTVGLSNVDTTMSAAGLANLPAVTAAGHAVIIIENEIVYVTAHTAAATTATILRGQEGTTAAAHAINVAWAHGPVVSDYVTVLGYAQVVANQGSITAEVDLTSLSLTVTVPYSGHRIRITGHGQMQNTSATTLNVIRIQENGVQIEEGSMVVGIANTGETIHAEAIRTPAAGSVTYKLRGAVGSGTGTLKASATQPSWILVEDLGPAL